MCATSSDLGRVGARWPQYGLRMAQRDAAYSVHRCKFQGAGRPILLSRMAKTLAEFREQNSAPETCSRLSGQPQLLPGPWS
jgi:hypothetical protein